MAKERIFRFKQFSVKHEVNAMKVCTEACILGAYAPLENVKKVLEIGTGTGLLTLMGAQRSDASFVGIELVNEFSLEAMENVKNSPWSNRIQIVNQSFEAFSEQTPEKFDFILSNPPFYSNQLLSPDKGKNIALHSQSFDHEHFMERMEKLLTPIGRICLLLPPSETNFYLEKSREVSLFVSDQLLIKNRPQTVPFRSITTFGRTPSPGPLPTELCIYDEGTEYTDDFKQLLWPFYTIFE